MADINVSIGKIEVKVLPITQKVFKQIVEESDWQVMMKTIKSNPETVLGWVSGAVTGENHIRWLIFNTPQGWRKYQAMGDTADQFPQLFIEK